MSERYHRVDVMIGLLAVVFCATLLWTASTIWRADQRVTVVTQGCCCGQSPRAGAPISPAPTAAARGSVAGAPTFPTIVPAPLPADGAPLGPVATAVLAPPLALDFPAPEVGAPDPLGLDYYTPEFSAAVPPAASPLPQQLASSPWLTDRVPVYVPAQVPEPATWGLMLLALAAIVLCWWGRRP